MSGTITLNTERLVLRRHRVEDALPLHKEFGRDEKMFEFSGWNPYETEEQAEETVQRFIGGYDEEHFYGWAIDYQGELAGTIGAYDYDAEANSIEIGCSIARRFWGKGFASEAVKAVLDYLLEKEKIGSVTAWCAADNIGSARVMEKAGMRQESWEEGVLEIGGKRYDKLNYAISAGATSACSQAPSHIACPVR